MNILDEWNLRKEEPCRVPYRYSRLHLAFAIFDVLEMFYFVSWSLTSLVLKYNKKFLLNIVYRHSSNDSKTNRS